MNLILRLVLVPLSASNLWTCSISAYKSVVVCKGYTYAYHLRIVALVKPSIAFSLISLTITCHLSGKYQYFLTHIIIFLFQLWNLWRKIWHLQTFIRSSNLMHTCPQYKTITFMWIPSDSAPHLTSRPPRLLT